MGDYESVRERLGEGDRDSVANAAVACVREATDDKHIADQLLAAMDAMHAVSAGKVSRSEALLGIIQRGLTLTDEDMKRSEAGEEWMAGRPADEDRRGSMTPEELLADWFRFWIRSDECPAKLPNALQVRTVSFLTFKAVREGRDTTTPFDL